MKPPYVVLFAALTLALVFGVVAPAAGGGGIAFARTSSYSTGNSPWAVAVGDLNGDGRPDLAVAHGDVQTPGAVGVFDNLGGGGFGTRQDYSVDTLPTGLVMADLNGDGRQDLATANSNDGTVSVLFNSGHGFQIAQPYGVGGAPAAIVASDLNLDGAADLIVTQSRADRLRVLLGGIYGFAGFEAPTGQTPLALAVRDLNRDRLPDVVTANSGGGSISVLLQDGSGVFAPKRDYGTNAEPAGVAIGDLNGDGAPDLAVTDVSDSVSVLLNDGSGGFGAAHGYPVGSAPVGVAIVDLNADGAPDVEVANADDGTVSVLLNKGGGVLDAKRDYRASDGASSLAVADMNGDGKLDLATSNNSDGTASVLIAKPGACDVQDVSGKALRAAKSTLSRFNCRVGKVTRRYSRSVRRGIVISQKPGFGAVLPGGGRVKLVVSLGRKR